jgi:hypothetical protein
MNGASLFFSGCSGCFASESADQETLLFAGEGAF